MRPNPASRWDCTQLAKIPTFRSGTIIELKVDYHLFFRYYFRLVAISRENFEFRGAFGPIFVLSSGYFNLRGSFHYGGSVECIPKTHPFKIPAPVV
jgi:hypothetical protein